MNNENSGNAVKLYVFVDTSQFTCKNPISVIISKYKTIKDLKLEFAKKKDYLFDEQHWVINCNYCYDEFEMKDIVENMCLFKKGYPAYLFIMSIEDKNEITEYFGSYIERLYSKVTIEQRWNEPQREAMIIADIIDTSKPQPPIGWNCESCTFFNKFFIKFCDICGNGRPETFQIPKNHYFTKDDKVRIDKDKAREEQAKKIEEETIKRFEQEKVENLEKLKQIYKTNLALTTEKTECPICVMEYEAGEAIVLRNCLHTICKDCFKGYLANITDPQVKCFDVNCIGHVEDQEIQAAIGDEEFEKYLQLSLRTAESKTPHTFHCKTPNCQSWVVYDDNVNFFDCTICKENNCLLCAAIHKDQTCKEYQDELEIKSRNDEAAKKDIAFLKNLIDTGQAMKCPGCQIIVQKKSGCDWMQCNMCKTEICWATKGPRWGPKGKGDSTGGCRCRINGKCAPNCGNCH